MAKLYIYNLETEKREVSLMSADLHSSSSFHILQLQQRGRHGINFCVFLTLAFIFLLESLQRPLSFQQWLRRSWREEFGK